MGIMAHAQVIDWKNPNFRYKIVEIKDSILKIDTLIVIPDKISIKNINDEEINPDFYSLDSSSNTLSFNSSLINKNLKISYYIYPEKKEKIIFSKDTSLIVRINKPKKYFEIIENSKKKNEFFQNLSSSGTLIRGITFGNNQSASVQSSLDLELSGQLSKDVRIKAAISDHNIPIQADGYTQRLDEFDKIYIELSTKSSYIRAGHLDLIQDKDYFGNFSRKITGIQIGTRIKNKKLKTNLYALGSLSRGEFNRMKFNGIEGNQGPYKLKGKQGELFIIVISGSEKVYMNGSLLKRGEDQDYIMNYNTGELTFTPKTYISSNSRIVVEYIYNTTTYTRFLLYTGGKYESNKFSFSANIFSENDTKESNQDLTDVQKNVLSTNTEYRFANGNVGINLALSNYDENTFSSVGNKKNTGYASKFYIDIKNEKNNWKSNLNLSHTFIQKNFHILERIHEVEFDRDFNISQEFNGINQHKFSLNWKNVFYDKWIVNYTFNLLDEKNFYTGYKNDILLGYRKKNTDFHSKISYLHTTQQDSIKSNFIKYTTEFNHKIGKLKIGVGYKGESNRNKNNSVSEYTSSSFNWNEIYTTFSLDSLKITTELKLYIRSDDSVRVGKLKNFTTSYGSILTNHLIKTQKHNLYLDFHYRKVHYSKAVYSNQNDENYILGSLRWNKILCNNGVQLNSAYELSSGQEAQREFKYVKVTDGKGIYKWTDYNGNGIEELDEFEVAEFSDQAQYIRVYTDNINYVKSNSNKFIFSLQISPSRFLRSSWWERIGLQSAFQSVSSYKKKNKTAELNPFSKSDLLTQTQSFTTNLSINRLSVHKWMATFQYMENNNTQYIFTGREKRNNDNFQVLLNYKPWKFWIFAIQSNLIKDKSRSQLFSTKRFTIETSAINPSVTYEIQKNISLSTLVKYQNKKNILGNERLDWREVGLELRWNDEKRTSLTGSYSYIKNDLKGNNYSLVSSQMMEGLLSGKNSVWKIYLQRELSSVFTLNIIYDGRKSEESQAIHTGSVQIRASF